MNLPFTTHSPLSSIVKLPSVRQGLDRDHQDYTLAHDEVFIETLRKKGVSQRIIDEAIVVTHNNNITHPLSELQEKK